jgi:S-formylglutathione hydrolase
MMLTTISEHKCFAGVQGIYSHVSTVTSCTMRFAVFMPPQAPTQKVPVLYWLSGLTCTEENFIAKAGAQRVAAELGLAIVVCDTSPRGSAVPDVKESYDFGIGAGFYVDALLPVWRDNFRMYSYVTQDLPELIAANFAIDCTRSGIFGHSMGGHGALVIALRNPDFFKSVSAFAPICSPATVPWGEKAFTGYLGDDHKSWQDYDAVSLIKARGWTGPEILIDQGNKDQFLEQQLKPDLFLTAANEAGVKVNLRLQEGYDHSYYFISTFIADHLRLHAKNLG